MKNALQNKVAFYTLGCKLNFAESSTLARMLREQGWETVDFGATADLLVINTCSVTENADRKCRRVVKQGLKGAPEAYVIVVGCYAQLKPEEIAAIPGVDMVLGANEKFRLTDHLDDLRKKKHGEFHACAIDDVNTFVASWSSDDRTRTFLKVQDGCDYNCSFCTIPMARGKSRSARIHKVVEQAHKIAELGTKEIVLTGVNIGDFGKGQEGEDTQKESFLDLIRALDKVEGIERFRISSIEPNLLNDEIIEFVASSGRFVPHFHIPLQSGNDKILKGMRRRYLSELYVRRVEAIRRQISDCCIGVDVITGFPGETHEDFLITYNFLNDLDISYLHVFPYSERNNTLAAEMKDVVPQQERYLRSQQLRQLSMMKRRKFYSRFSHTIRPVLFEMERQGDQMTGFTDNYIKVKAPYDSSLVNQVIEVELQEPGPDDTVPVIIVNALQRS